MFLARIRSWNPSRGFVFSFIILSMLGLFLVNAAYGIASTSWPSVTGTIIKSELEETNDNTTIESIAYTYTVNDQNYMGERPSFVLSNHLLERYPKGKVVPVYYNPENPYVSVLEPGIGIKSLSPTAYLLLLVLGVAMLGIIAALWQILMPKKRPQQDL